MKRVRCISTIMPTIEVLASIAGDHLPLGTYRLGNGDLTLGAEYTILEECDGMVRLVDDSGEDYWYPVECFQ